VACRPSRAANRAKTGTAGVEPALNDVGVLKRIFRVAQASGTRSDDVLCCRVQAHVCTTRGAEREAIGLKIARLPLYVSCRL
jgi:hypothetical protein